MTAKGRKLREHQASRAPEHTRHVLWGALVHRQAWRAKAMQLRNGFLQCCHVGAQGMCTEARASGTSFPVDSGVSASGNPCPIPYGDRLILRNTYPPAHATTWGQCAHAGKDFDVQAPHVRAAWRPAHAQPRGRAAIDRNGGAEVGQHVVQQQVLRSAPQLVTMLCSRRALDVRSVYACTLLQILQTGVRMHAREHTQCAPARI